MSSIISSLFRLIARLDVSIYFNGTLASTAPGAGIPFRWTDTTAFFLGGAVYPVCVCV